MQATLSGSTGNLPFELSKFRKYLRYLRKILNNTKGAIDDIIRSGFFTEEQLRDINLKQDDEDKIRSIIENSVGIVILGSKSWAKAAIVNELLGYQLLPVNSINGVDWRTIRLMYGQQTQVSLAVNDHYELIDHLAIYDRIWHQIPANELQINHSQDSADPGYPSATLEIKLPHHLLADDVQMIVAPSTSSVLSFEQICQNVFRNVLPIVIYAYSEADSLSAREIDDLMELKRLQPKLPVFFVCTSVTECGPQSVLEPSSTPSHADQVSAASELTESQQHVYFNDIHSDPSSSQAPPQATGDEVDSANKLEQSPAASNAAEPTASTSATAPGHSQTIFQQLTSVGFLSPPALKSPATWSAVGSKADRTINSKSKSKRTKDATVPSELVEKFENFAQVLQFSRNVLQSHLVRAASMLYTVHMACLRVFILTAFDMTRDIMITPKRIHYAKDREQQLFESLMAIANRKQEEIKDLISDTIKSMRSDLLNEAARYRFTNDKINRSTCVVGSSSFDGQDFFRTSAIGPKQDSDHSSDEDAGPAGGQSSPSSSDASARSEEMPRQEAKGDRSSDQNSSMNVNYRISPREYQNALNELQDYVLGQLNAAIAGKLVGSVDFLRDSYVGTLERCLSSLEQFTGSRHENASDSVQATNALKSILNAAYQVEINIKATSSLIRSFWEKMKQLVTSSLLWSKQPVIDEAWKVRVASDILDNLSEWRLAKSIIAQFKERLRMSHEQFVYSLRQLENLHSGRLERTEEARLKVRKAFAPKIARYALESTSLRDLILYGMPQLGREIGRGQYGVVYSSDSWAGLSPVALKSVVPPDDKHWNDLAMEFYYTRSIPEHDRIVQIRGSVIDYSYGGGNTPAVLLIMDRLSRDLYSAIRSGLDLVSRMQVAIDVVQGIRFLHSQGLVHRDIKLKNVLLDKRNRAKITDLGFCKPEAMMSGSIVGTPIHMAPELFSGKYDNSVDVYAFGILFWYICAGHVRLPYVFEQCQNKDQLWNCVRKGARPERLPQFDPECWTIMEQCWSGDPSARPLLGDVEPKLICLLEKSKHRLPVTSHSASGYHLRSNSVPRGTPSDRRPQFGVRGTNNYVK